MTHDDYADADHDEDRHAARRRWNAMLADIDAEIRDERLHGATFEPDLGKVLEQPAPPKPPVIVKPGNYYARLAYEQGNEDEYSNRMKARYGGEW